MTPRSRIPRPDGSTVGEGSAAPHGAPRAARREPVRLHTRTVTGNWTSELGSRLELHCSDGLLTGHYSSAVGATRAPRPLIGFATPPSGSDAAVLGFVVPWSGIGSVTTWTGRYDRPTDRIFATWVLQSRHSPSTAWAATQIGQDVFVRGLLEP